MIKLRDQIDLMYPGRDKSSDGTEASPQHSRQNPKSDHEARIRHGNEWVVTAIDFTHDPRHGCDCEKIVQQLIDSKDNRIKYIIWRGHITSGPQGPFAWRRRKRNKGSSDHAHHMHLSVRGDPLLFDNTAPWKVHKVEPNYEEPVIVSRPTLRVGSKGRYVRELQTLLKIEADGWFADQTERAVKGFQRVYGLEPDGVVGRYTWDALLENPVA